MKTAHLSLVSKQPFFFDFFTGSLMQFNYKSSFSVNPPNIRKLQRAIELVENPFLLKPVNKLTNIEVQSDVYMFNYANRLTRFTQFTYWFGRVYSYLGKRSFSDSTYAFDYYRKFILPDKQDGLCLPRALFAASTSKLFPSSGVIFIGIFLPSRTMHAWIIENDKQPDLYDNIWINYEPIAILY